MGSGMRRCRATSDSNSDCLRCCDHGDEELALFIVRISTAG
jgi:hypothetical protein